MNNKPDPVSKQQSLETKPPEKLAAKNQAGTNKSGGGVFVAFGCIGGVFVGGLLGQPSIGFLVGLATGIVIASAIWYFDR